MSKDQGASNQGQTPGQAIIETARIDTGDVCSDAENEQGGAEREEAAGTKRNHGIREPTVATLMGEPPKKVIGPTPRLEPALSSSLQSYIAAPGPDPWLTAGFCIRKILGVSTYLKPRAKRSANFWQAT